MGASPKIPRAVREPGIALRYDTTVEGFVGRPRPRSAQRSLGAALTAGSRLVAATTTVVTTLSVVSTVT